MSEIVKFCKEIESLPGGLDYFYAWVKYNFNEEWRRVKVVNNYYDSNGYSVSDVQQKPSKRSETTFIELSKKYLTLKKETVQNQIEEKSKCIESANSIYKKILTLPGGYYFFYGWLRANHGDKFSKYTQDYMKRKLKDQEVINKIFYLEYKHLEQNLSSLSKEYFSSIKEYGHKLIIENIPDQLKISFQQYFLFFNEYVLNTKQEEISVEVSITETGLSFNLMTEKDEEINKIKNYLNEYISFAKEAISNETPVQEVIEEIKASQIAKLQLEAQISHLKLNLKLKETENRMLESQNEFLKSLSLKLADNSSEITNQIITDGQQQFANKIKNLD